MVGRLWWVEWETWVGRERRVGVVSDAGGVVGDVGGVVPVVSGAVAWRREELDAFTDGWLANRRLSGHTREAYRRDVRSFLDWCLGRELDPLAVSFVHVNAYARELESTSDPRTGRPLAPTTVARKLSGLSSWYAFLQKINAISANPVGGADRPRVARDHSATIGLSGTEVDALLAAAERDGGPGQIRNQAVVAILADLGLRVGELVSLDIEDLGYERGHRSVRFTGKGGTHRRRALTPASTAAVETYLLQRAARAGVSVDDLGGALFVTASGARLDRHSVFRLVRRLAELAGIPAWAQLSPHSLRHAFATAARDEGVPLEDVQDAMGHADPRTTRRYDRDRHNLDRDPSYAIWSARARRRNAD
jgi:integrase/recombinase XerD